MRCSVLVLNVVMCFHAVFAIDMSNSVVLWAVGFLCIIFCQIDACVIFVPTRVDFMTKTYGKNMSI